MRINKNIPNLLSGYRLLIFPVLLFLILKRVEVAFAWLICINLITDILDGIIARRFNLQTSFGAKLDSAADVTTYAAAIYGVYVFKWVEIEPFKALFFGFVGLYTFSMVVGLIKFKQLPSLHLYSFKIMGYFHGIFLFILFVFGFVKVLFFVALGWGIWACFEEILVLLVLKKMKNNAKGLFWVLKDKGW